MAFTLSKLRGQRNSFNQWGFVLLINSSQSKKKYEICVTHASMEY